MSQAPAVSPVWSAPAAGQKGPAAKLQVRKSLIHDAHAQGGVTGNIAHCVETCW